MKIPANDSKTTKPARTKNFRGKRKKIKTATAVPKPKRPERDLVNSTAEKINAGTSNGIIFLYENLWELTGEYGNVMVAHARGIMATSQAASQFGWPKVAKTLSWTLGIQQEVSKWPRRTRQE